MIKEVPGADAATYLSILAAVAGGATRQSEIADRAGIDPTAAGKYLAGPPIVRNAPSMTSLSPCPVLAAWILGTRRGADARLMYRMASR